MPPRNQYSVALHTHLPQLAVTPTSCVRASHKPHSRARSTRYRSAGLLRYSSKNTHHPNPFDNPPHTRIKTRILRNTRRKCGTPRDERHPERLHLVRLKARRPTTRPPRPLSPGLPNSYNAWHANGYADNAEGDPSVERKSKELLPNKFIQTDASQKEQDVRSSSASRKIEAVPSYRISSRLTSGPPSGIQATGVVDTSREVSLFRPFRPSRSSMSRRCARNTSSSTKEFNFDVVRVYNFAPNDEQLYWGQRLWPFTGGCDLLSRSCGRHKFPRWMCG